MDSRDQDFSRYVDSLGCFTVVRLITNLWASIDPTFDPIRAAKNDRKQRKLKNEKQHLLNLQRAASISLKASGAAAAPKPKQSSVPAGLMGLESGSTSSSKTPKSVLEAQLHRTRASTASLGRFDRTLSKDDEKLAKKAERGTKRKFESASEFTAEKERDRDVKILKSLGKDDRAAKERARDKQSKGQGDSELFNARKAIRHASKGQGAAALLGKEGGKSKGKGRR